MIIIMFGAPGVGKGTQATILADKLNVAHLSTGDAFRSAIKNQTEVGILAKSFVDAGDLVPDEVVSRIVEEAMSAPACKNGVILDGFPRTQAQADALASILEKNGQSITKVVNIEVDDSTIIERLLERGRTDDTKEVIANRLVVYREETSPLLSYYMTSGNLTSVDGIGSVEEVNNRILASIA